MDAIELFAGAGGLGMGVSLAGFNPAMVVEWDKWCCDTIRENQKRKVNPVSEWPEPVQGDVRLIDFKHLEGKVDLVTGGPPCQPFSLGGKHNAQEDSRDMWPEAVRAVNETKPLAFIFENVKGLTRASFSNYLAYIVQQLTYPEIKKNISEEWEDHLIRLERHHTSRKSYEGLTYQVAYRVLNAANFGVPQKRERVVFVGFRSDLGVAWAFPEETHSRAALVKSQSVGGTYWDWHGIAKGERNPLHEKIFFLSKSVQRDELKPWRTVRDAIGDLPDPEKSIQKASLFLNHKFQGGARSYVGHTGSPLDEPAKTLKAGVHGVPGGENMLVRPDGSVRYFSVRESARLQTFPDSYAFHGAWSEAMRQLGNAVPVELSTVIATSVHNSLSQIGSN